MPHEEKRKIRVAVFTYARPDESRQCFRALQHSLKRMPIPVTVFQDGLPADCDENLRQRHSAVHQIAQSQCRENGWEYVLRTENYGLSKSIVSGLNELFHQCDAVVALEDDIIVTDSFLLYMAEGLEYYKNYPEVYGISGHNFYNKKDAASLFSETFLLPIGTSWGWATWKEKWSVYCDDASALTHEIQSASGIEKFNFGGYPFWTLLQRTRFGLSESWAVCYYASFFLRSGSFVFPRFSLCQNVGSDSNATNTAGKNPFFPRILKPDFFPSKWAVKTDAKLVSRMADHFIRLNSPSRGLWPRIKQLLFR